jgi:hypothetical protein
MTELKNGVERSSAPGARSIDQFCADHNISRAFFYLLRNRGEGPVEMAIGKRRLISDEAAAAWRREREQKQVRAS